MPARFNTPPGWPTPPAGWVPPPGWQPDPTWPSAPAGWQFWIDDGHGIPTSVVHSRPSASTGNRFTPAQLGGWGGLVVVVLLGMTTGGFGASVIMLGLYVGVVGVIALIRGRVGWAGLASRAAGGVTTVAALVALVIGSAMTPDASSPSPEVAIPVARITGTSTKNDVEPSSTPKTSSSKPKTTAPKVRPAAKRPQTTTKPKPKPKPTKTTAKPKPQPKKAIPKDDGCDPNYAGACVPEAEDVDCAGGSGNGPAYFDGVARVVGDDIYDLDRDGDGYACDTD